MPTAEESADHRQGTGQANARVPWGSDGVVENLALPASLLSTFQLKAINYSLLCLAMEPAFIKDLDGRHRSNWEAQTAL